MKIGTIFRTQLPHGFEIFTLRLFYSTYLFSAGLAVFLFQNRVPSKVVVMAWLKFAIFWIFWLGSTILVAIYF